MASAPNSQPVKSKNLIHCVSGESTSYPSMVSHQLEDVHEDIEGKYFLITLPACASSVAAALAGVFAILVNKICKIMAIFE